MLLSRALPSRLSNPALRQDVLNAIYASDEEDSFADYLRRGRRFGYTSLPKLQSDWVGAYWAWATDGRNAAARSLITDCGCELILRNADMPFDQVLAVLTLAQKAIERWR